MPNITDTVTVETEVSTVTTATEGSTATVTATQAAETPDEEMYPDFIGQVIGRCPNIPTGVHVDILYATAGLSNWKPIYNIIGAKIR